MSYDINLDMLENAFKATKKAYALLKKAQNKDEIEAFQDSCIKRFEFTVETSRKLMSRFLSVEYGKSKEELKTKNIFRLMEGYSLIPSWERWSDYVEKRNDTSHEYDLEKARVIIDILPEFIKDVDVLIKNLKKALKQ